MLNQLGIHVAVLAIQGRIVFSTAILLQCEKENKLNVNCTKLSSESFQSEFVATEDQYHKKMKSISERCLYYYTKNIKKDVILQLEPTIVLKEKYDPSKVGPESATKSLNELGSYKYSYLAFYASVFHQFRHVVAVTLAHQMGVLGVSEVKMKLKASLQKQKPMEKNTFCT